MFKRITTWLAGLAFVAALQKRMRSESRAAAYSRFQTLRQRRFARGARFMLPWQRQRTLGFMARQRGMMRLPWQTQLPWQTKLPWQMKLTRQMKLPRQLRMAGQMRMPWQRRTSRMAAFRPILMGLGLGALAMYLFDTQWGNRRRAQLRDQATHLTNVTEDAAEKTARDVRNRAVGLVSEAQNPSGRGSNGDFKSTPDMMQERWSPTTRLIGGLAGTALAASTFGVGGLPRVAGSAVGLGLVARSLTNLPVKRLVGMGAGRRAVDIQKAIVINAPVEEVFNFYSNFENFPRFMANVRDVRDLGEGRSHWTVDGPAGITAEWNARITQFEPDRLIAWRSEEDSNVGNAGVVRFDPQPSGGTRLNVRLSYNPPGGALGHAVATLFNSNPKQQMDEDLARLKTLIETGSTSVEGQKVRREELKGGQGHSSTHFGDRTGAVTAGRFGDGPNEIEIAREPVGQYAWEADQGQIPGERDIPRDQWRQFCEQFGQMHSGDRVTVETQHADGSQSTIANNQPLFELSNEQHDGAFDLRLVMGDEVNEQLAHNVTNVDNMRLRINDQGVTEALLVRSGDETTTVRFLGPSQQ